METQHIPVEIFCSCSDSLEDAPLLKQLEHHLSTLQRMGLISVWHTRKIVAGSNWQEELDYHLGVATLILLLVSSDFISSDYCYGTEMQRALQRHAAKEARVMLILLRPCVWQIPQFTSLEVLPAEGVPITKWSNQDEAWTNVVMGIHQALEGTSVGGVQDAPSAFEQVQSRSLDPTRPTNRFRRAVIVGLATAMICSVSGNLVWQAYNRSSTPHSPTSDTPTPNVSTRNSLIPTSSPTLPPIGTRLYTYLGHSPSLVWAVGWSPNRNRIASGSSDKTVQVWNATDGGNVFIYSGHTDELEVVAWSPDGYRIASGSGDKTVQVWNAIDGGNAFIYKKHTAWVNAVAWSPDGKRIASGSDDRTVQVWNMTDGSSVVTYRGHSHIVYAAAWSPDGKRIASGGRDNTVQVWDATDGSNILTYRGHSDAVYAVAWSPDGKYIASGGSDHTVQVWDATHASQIFTYRGHSNLVETIAWSPDGKRLASGSADKTAQVWSMANGSSITYRGHSNDIEALVWSPDGTRIASAGDVTVQVWEAK